MMKLKKDFYTRDAITVAKELLGKFLVREINSHTLVSMITETEAYTSYDKACHAYNYNMTPRTSTLFKEGGIAYVYFTYGMYNMLNVVADKKGEPAAVLIRGLKPLKDIEYMSILRYNKSYENLSKYQINNFTNGPGKLCMAYSVDRNLNGEDLSGNTLYITEGEKITDFKTGKRIGIDYAEEAKDFLWRFYL